MPDQSSKWTISFQCCTTDSLCNRCRFSLSTRPILLANDKVWESSPKFLFRNSVSEFFSSGKKIMRLCLISIALELEHLGIWCSRSKNNQAWYIAIPMSPVRISASLNSSTIIIVVFSGWSLLLWETADMHTVFGRLYFLDVLPTSYHCEMSGYCRIALGRGKMLFTITSSFDISALVVFFSK